MAPEILTYKKYTDKLICGLGVMLFEMLTGTTPVLYQYDLVNNIKINHKLPIILH